MVARKVVILFFTVVLFSKPVISQSLDELQAQKASIEKRIEDANNLIASYAKSKTANMRNVNVLNRQIADREKLIGLYEDEIGLLKGDITVLEAEISDNEHQLEQLKEQYVKLIQTTYNNKKRYNELSFFLGAKSFNEFYRRYIMLKEYNKFRYNQGLLIDEKRLELKDSYGLLNTKLKVQNNALKKILNERERLVGDKASLNANIQELKRKESRLKRDIQRQKKTLQKLETTIVNLIAELSKETVEASDFHLAKGQLINPVENGVIVSKFGEHAHPVLKYVKVKNNGVDIQSSNNIAAKAVFSGKVSRIVSIPGYNKAVLIRHGRFLTVYANLDSVRVKKGENVTKNSLIGTIYNGQGENSGVLHFEIWEESKKLNPEHWLMK
ncbi:MULTISPECIES: murein hydrolase activator EnvC family protein [unclassified Carboxylicivirga]|uniref:murein hydrolase activator EnvC family protein n=1 Tax=Carboxylicivirga TaxID=1628153 RepID=UPI003D35374D